MLTAAWQRSGDYAVTPIPSLDIETQEVAAWAEAPVNLGVLMSEPDAHILHVKHALEHRIKATFTILRRL